MRIELALRTAPPVLVDFAGVLPEKLRTLTEPDIAATRVWIGNQAVPLGELCAITLRTGDDAACALELIGDCSLLNNVGAEMSTGALIVHGSIGDRAGAGMTGGRLHIHGNAGDALGEAMAGGAIHVDGDCGDAAGAAKPGARLGMTGGRIEIYGQAGAGLGARLRRGWMEVHGDCGPRAGEEMIAGTIRVHGRIGAYAGCGMIRGTIIAETMEEPGPGFVPACEYEPIFCRLLNPRQSTRVLCYRGDLLTGGRGELWLTNSAA